MGWLSEELYQGRRNVLFSGGAEFVFEVGPVKIYIRAAGTIAARSAAIFFQKLAQNGAIWWQLYSKPKNLKPAYLKVNYQKKGMNNQVYWASFNNTVRSTGL